MTAVINVIEKAREIIDAGWTKEAYARDIEGNSVDVLSEKACSFCILGALSKAAWDTGSSVSNLEINRPFYSILSSKGYVCISTFNDTRDNKEEMLEFIDEVLGILR